MVESLEVMVIFLLGL